MKTCKLQIIGCGIGEWRLPDSAYAYIENADFVVAGTKLLEQFRVPLEKRIPLKANAAEVVKGLVESPREGKVVMLASGDSLYFGAGASVVKHAHPDLELEIYPNITAFQYLFAKAGIPWSGAALFSIHGLPEGKTPPLRKIASNSNIAVVYCDKKVCAGRLAGELISLFPEIAEREALIGVDLGTENEVVEKRKLKDFASKSFDGLSILVLLETENPLLLPVMPIGFDDDFFEHENNLITHPEVRAVILSKLNLRGGVLWDLGAGSGSVGLEAAALNCNLQVHAVEHHSEKVEHIRKNAAKLGVDNHSAIEGELPDALRGLPEPHTIFIGGGGLKLADIVTESFAKLKSGGILVVSAVTLESIALLTGLLPEVEKDVVSVSVSKAHDVGPLTMMKAENQITIFSYKKKGVQCRIK